MLHNSIRRRFFLYAISIAFFCVLGYFLNQVFSGALILPQSFNLGLLAIHYYGIIMALAVAAGFYFALKRAAFFGLDARQAEDILFWVIIGGFIGARLYHVFSSWAYYWRYPLDILKVWNGGLSIYGAVLGGILTLWLYKRISHFPFSIFNSLDWLAPSVLLGQIIGRFGNLFNYEAFGYPTNLPWRMFVPAQFRPPGFGNFSFFHPFFLYELIGSLIILFLLLKVIKLKVSGGLFFWYLLLYNLLRFALEFLRIDSTFIYGFRLNAGVSLILALVGAAGIFYLNRNVKTS